MPGDDPLHSVQSVLAAWVKGNSVGGEECEQVMDHLLSGSIPDGLIGGLLVAGLTKRLNAEELAGFARGMRSHALNVEGLGDDVVDTCGTGGGAPTFNLSTASAFVAAGAGAKVAKHGNRGVTSSCGSADVLEAMGAKLLSDPVALKAVFERCGVVFMFAMNHHGAMKAVSPVRKALGVRTFFNLLGPLSNPAGAKRQVIGVYEAGATRLVAETLVKLGTERSMVVHATDRGMDEVSPSGETVLLHIDGGEITEQRVTPIDFGLEGCPTEHLHPAETVEGNAELLLEAISKPDSLRCRAVLPNAACALYVAGLAATLREGAVMARESVASGAALAKAREFIAATAEVGG